MTLSVQGIIAMLVIGLVIGGIAGIITQGRALVTYRRRCGFDGWWSLASRPV